MTKTETEREKLIKVTERINAEVNELTSIAKKAIHDAERKQRRLDTLYKESTLADRLVRDIIQLVSAYSTAKNITPDNIYAITAALLATGRDKAKEVDDLRASETSLSRSDFLLNDIIKLVSKFSTNPLINRGNVYGVLTSLLPQCATTREILDKLKSIL